MTTPILPQLAESSLQDISNQRKLKFEKRRPSKQSMIEALGNDINAQGIKAFVHVLQTSDLKALSAKLDKEVLSSNGANNPSSKSVLSKRVSQAMTDKGVNKFLSSVKNSEKTLTAILERLGIEATSKKTADMVKQIETEIQYMGLSAIFSNCTVKQLQAFASDLGLTVESSAKTVLLRCILQNTSYTAEDKPKIVRKPKAKKDKAAKENADADGDMDMEDSDLPRAAPPKFDWEASEDDEGDFEADEDASENQDVEMSDVASEDEENNAAEDDDEEDKEDGEYQDE